MLKENTGDTGRQFQARPCAGGFAPFTERVNFSVEQESLPLMEN